MSLPVLPILYSFRRCPYAIRARLALRCAGIRVALREVALRDKPAALRLVSPKATVPVLLLPDGRVLEESLHIMEWALQISDPDGWLRAGDAEQGQLLIARNDGPFKLLLDRYKYPSRGLDAAQAADPACVARVQSEQRAAAVALHLAPLEQRLSASRFLLADSPALADMATMPFVRQFMMVDASWFGAAALPSLRRWLAELVSSALFESVMVKLDVWRPGASEPVF
jgi:glutathione S-transferase